MNAYTAAGIAAARQRLRKLDAELRKAVECSPGSPEVWTHLGKALEHARYCDAQLGDALQLEELAPMPGPAKAALRRVK